MTLADGHSIASEPVLNVVACESKGVSKGQLFHVQVNLVVS